MILRQCLIGLFLIGACPVHAAEKHVTISQKLEGAWLTPDASWDGRSVLMLHGFADDMDGAGDLVKRLAQALAGQGIATLRINFRGEGDKARTDIGSTFDTRRSDTEAAYAFLLKQPGVNAAKVGCFGWSLGASNAVVVGGMHPAWFCTMCLWASPVGDQFKQMTDNECAQMALQSGVGTLVVPGWKTMTIKRDFYESFRGVDLTESLKKYPGDFFLIRGTLDTLQAEKEFLAVATGRRAEALIIAGADHIFNVFDSRKEFSSRVLSASVEWFAQTL